MSAKKFNEEEVAKEAIVTSPEITENEDIAPKGGKEAGTLAANEPLDGYQADAERNGRLFKKAVKKAAKDIDDDLADAAGELSTEIFSLMNEFRVPKAVHITILAALLTVPLIGPLLKIINPKQKEESHGNTSHDIDGS